MAIVALLGVAGLLIYRVNDEIRSRVEAKFAEKYPDLAVSVRAAQLIDGEGIEIRGLSIAQPDVHDSSGELAYFDEIFLKCPTSLDQLIQGDVPVSHIIVRRPVLRGTRYADGSWSISRLLPIPKFSDRSPDSIVVENATLELLEPQKGPTGKFTLRDVSFTITPGDRFEQDNPELLDIRGSVASDHVRRLEFAGKFDPKGQGWIVDATVETLDISPELELSLPHEIGQHLSVLGSLRGQASGDVHLGYNPALPAPFRFDIDGVFTGGRIDDPRIPNPITEIEAQVQATNAGLHIRELTARAGQTTLWMSCHIGGYTRTSPIHIELQAQKMLIEREWFTALPPSLQACWHKFSPEGEFNAHLVADFDGQRWTPQLTVECSNAAFSYYKFPYRVTGATGTLKLLGQKLLLDLQASAAGEPLVIGAEVWQPGEDFTGWVTVAGKNLSLDHQALAAMPEQSRELVRSLNATGTFDLNLLVRRDRPDQEPVSRDLTITLNGCGIKYDKFRYPIRNIVGQVRMIDDVWSFGKAHIAGGNWVFDEPLRGSNGAGQIACSGTLLPVSDGGTRLWLNFSGQNIGLHDELRDALPEPAGKTWGDLRPRGAIDLTTEVVYFSATKKLDVSVDAWPRQDVNTSIEPVFFPYRLEKVRGGKVSYRKGLLQFERMTAQHGDVFVASSGSVELPEQGGWRLRLKDLTADRLRLDRDRDDLLAALPPRLKKTLTSLRPSGPIYLRGDVELTHDPGPENPLTSKWDLTFQLQQSSLNCGVPIENVSGGVRLIGGHDGARFSTNGELDLDSVTFKGFQFSGVRGPLLIDENRALFGVWASPQENAAARRITASAYGGAITGDAWIRFDTPSQFGLQAELTGADLARFAGEALPGRQDLRGKVSGAIGLKGTAAGTHTLQGEGAIWLRDADVYELPLMVSLLKILGARQPDTKAFTSSDLQFRLEGEHLYFNPIEFVGDAISLRGEGEMNYLTTEMHLKFHSLMGRSDMQLPVWKDLVKGFSQEIMLIHVDGDLSDPKTRSEAFPGVAAALQGWQGRPRTPQSADPRPLPGYQRR